MGSTEYSTEVEVKKEQATELEFLKYLYDNMDMDELIYLTDGFQVDTGKQLPEGYDTPIMSDSEEASNFWDNFNEDKVCSTCPNLSKCNKDEE